MKAIDSEATLVEAMSRFLTSAGLKVKRGPRLGLFENFRPDLLVEDARGRRVIIEVKVGPLGLTDVVALRKLRAYRVVVVLSREAADRTAGSVVDYANASHVEIVDEASMPQLAAALAA